jgi:hypothetical protein
VLERAKQEHCQESEYVIAHQSWSKFVLVSVLIRANSSARQFYVVFCLFAFCSSVFFGEGEGRLSSVFSTLFSFAIDRSCARSRIYTCTAVFMSRCCAAALLSVRVFVRRGKCRF